MRGQRDSMVNPLSGGGPARFVAYYRVSTDKQGQSGLGLEAQAARVTQTVEALGGLVVKTYTEIESGKRNARPQLQLALAECRMRRAALIIAKLDRLTRNTLFLLTLVEGLGDGGVVFCDLPQLPAGPLGKFFLTLMAAVAELEAGLISERTKAALAVVKAAIAETGGWTSRRSGQLITRLGGPVSVAIGNHAGAHRARRIRAAIADQRAADVAGVIADIQKTGACRTLGQIARALTARGIATPAGASTWTATQVSRAIARHQRFLNAAE